VNPTPSDSDETLFARYRDTGDPEAFGSLYDRYASGLLRFLRVLVRDRASAEDVLQQSFLKIHSARAAFDENRSFRPWAFAIARRAALNWREREARRAHPEIPDDHPDPSPSPEDLAGAREQIAAVQSALSRLSPQDAEVLILFKYESLSYPEIGEVLGCSSDAAKMRVHRALRRLVDRLPDGLRGTRPTA
jgi:RNA polymerase sigma-70 factor (ECF subfamily)